MERDPSITHLRFEYDEQSWISENAGSPQEYMPDLSVYYKISAHFKSILRRAMIDSATSYHGLLFIEGKMYRLLCHGFWEFNVCIRRYGVCS